MGTLPVLKQVNGRFSVCKSSDRTQRNGQDSGGEVACVSAQRLDGYFG